MKLGIATVLPILLEHAKIKIARNITYSHFAVARVRQQRLLVNHAIA